MDVGASDRTGIPPIATADDDREMLFRRIISVISVLLLAGLSVLILLQSPFSPGSIQYPDTESSLYLYAGSQLLDGNMLYRDIFDFHGPLIFLVNAFGLFIGGFAGIWLLEIHVIIATLLIVFFMLRRSAGPVAAALTCLILALLIGYSLRGGNQIEEYTLLFQALALLGFVDYFVRRNLTLPSVYLIGLSAGLTLFTKPSLALFWLPYLVVTIVLLSKREGPGIAITRLVTILFSATLVFIVIIPWLYVNNALTSCFEQMTSYYQDYLSLATQREQLDALLYFIRKPSFILVALISLAALIRLVLLRRTNLIRRNDGTTVRQLMVSEDALFGRYTFLLIATNFVAAILVVLLMAVPGQPSEHYALQGLLCLVIPLAYVLHLATRVLSRRGQSKPYIALGVVLIVSLSLSLGVPGLAETLSRIREQREDSAELAQQRELIAEVQRQQGYDEPIIVFGNDCWIYTAADTYSATRYAYQPFDLGSRPALDADFYRQVGVAESMLLVGRIGEGLIERYPGIDEYERVFANRRYEVYRRLEQDVNQVEYESDQEGDQENGQESDQESNQTAPEEGSLNAD
jgi:hypothetical protein